MYPNFCAIHPSLLDSLVDQSRNFHEISSELLITVDGVSNGAFGAIDLGLCFGRAMSAHFLGMPFEHNHF